MELDQHELYEYARRRIKQKKGLYFHFVLFLVGSFFIFVANKWMNIGEPTNWYIWAITGWLFIFILHFIKVFITDSFMNKKWEREQINRLVTMQENKLGKLKNEVENEAKSI
ncbi:MAG: phosphotransferase system glucose/maltose/N-acetylglucosamine-specific IIC component [Flavobacterium sp.]|jgi:phosphotransferase system  glucose/maltose/N-acetylglucosamine-specific IIC component